MAPARNHRDTATRLPLTKQRIVLTALELVEQQGLDALTMRAVATALHVTPMSLYNHVANKAELVDLMADAIIGGIVEAAGHDTGDWESRLRSLAHHHFATWHEHPNFIKVYTQGVTVGPNALLNVELALSALRQGGLDQIDAARAFVMLYHWIVSSMIIAPAQPLNRSARATGIRGGTAEDRINRYFCALPIEQIPNVKATVMHLAGDHIDFGLDIIIDGLKSRIAASAGQAP